MAFLKTVGGESSKFFISRKKDCGDYYIFSNVVIIDNSNKKVASRASH